MTRAASLLLLLVLVACASAYDDTYRAETNRLEEAQASQDAVDRAAHAEASRYAAVLYFELGSSALDDAARHELRWFVEKMQPYPQAEFLVQGFADSTGSELRNLDLSIERAQAVTSYLVAQGVGKERLSVEAFSSNYPAGSNETPEGRNRNRRVEVTVR